MQKKKRTRERTQVQAMPWKDRVRRQAARLPWGPYSREKLAFLITYFVFLPTLPLVVSWYHPQLQEVTQEGWAATS